ncbi:MAG: phosphotransferase [Deltaproteobacteria bacterium]|nr:phosphotransferase [Deltaproteobacteria bacterium]
MSSNVASLFAELVCARFGSGTTVLRSEALAGDASTRRYARLWLAGASAPPTTVAMLLADRGIAMSSDELAVFKEPPKELPYLNVHRFLVKLGVAVPEVYVDASERGVLLLEDVGDTALWDAVQGQAETRVIELYQQAIDQLLLLEIEGTRQRDDTCLAFQQSFDERLYLWEFEHFIEYGIERRTGSKLPARDAECLRQNFGAIARRLDDEARVLNHRDFHSWNLYVHNGRLRVIDFQDALLAAAAYDLATLLGDRDTPQIVRPDIEARLLDYFIEGWRKRGAGPLDDDHFHDVYFLCALQKALKVVGRFFFLDIEKGKPGYLRFVPSTVRQILRILPRFSEYADMAALLRSYLPR